MLRGTKSDTTSRYEVLRVVLRDTTRYDKLSTISYYEVLQEVKVLRVALRVTTRYYEGFNRYYQWILESPHGVTYTS